VSIRERRWFWSSMPSKALAIVLVAETLLGSILTRAGLPGLTSLPWPRMLGIFAYAMLCCLVVNDSLKVLLIKRLAPEAGGR